MPAKGKNDAIEQVARDALPIGHTGQMVVKESIADGRVKVEVEPKYQDQLDAEPPGSRRACSCV
jgi:hypothetical protein